MIRTDTLCRSIPLEVLSDHHSSANSLQCRRKLPSPSEPNHRRFSELQMRTDDPILLLSKCHRSHTFHDMYPVRVPNKKKDNSNKSQSSNASV